MKSDLPILKQIKERVHRVNPSARIILFGSFARGDYRKDSDIDLLILVDEENISFHDKKEIMDPIYDLEFEIGQIISPIVRTKKEWEQKYPLTPLYENIQREGVEL